MPPGRLALRGGSRCVPRERALDIRRSAEALPCRSIVRAIRRSVDPGHVLEAPLVNDGKLTRHKREQARINTEVSEAESQLANDREKLAQAKQIIDLALDLAENCAASYRKASPEVRKMWTAHSSERSAFGRAQSPTSAYEEPIASFLGSQRGSMVEVRGFEPLTPAVRRQCSTGLSYTPRERSA